MIKGIFDSHAHYDDEAFDPDRNELLCKIHSENVDKIMTCGCDIASTISAKQLSEKFDFICFSAGFHPENEQNATNEDFETIRAFLSHQNCKAVGEIGLDYHYLDCCPKEIQLKLFEKQIIMANEHDLPVIVHDREAHQDTFHLLKKHKPRGVVHCFSGSREMMKEIVKLGMFIGINGVVTFKNARKSLEVAKEIPIDRLLLETDAPYLAPVPFRGKRCDSSLIEFTAQAIAQIRQIETDELISITNENATGLFNF